MSRVLLADVLQSPQDFGYNGNIHLRPISHKPIGGEILLPRSQTGWHKDQTIKIKNDYTWQPFLYNGKVAITTGETTDFCLGLGESRGFFGGRYSLREINELYLSKVTEVADLSEDMYDEMPETLKSMCYLYWLFSNFTDSRHRCSGMHYVKLPGVKKELIFEYDDASLATNSYYLAIRPTLYLKNRVWIDLDQLIYTKDPVKCYTLESD